VSDVLRIDAHRWYGLAEPEQAGFYFRTLDGSDADEILQLGVEELWLGYPIRVVNSTEIGFQRGFKRTRTFATGEELKTFDARIRFLAPEPQPSRAGLNLPRADIRTRAASGSSRLPR
jgi:hypothetical protein